MADISNAILATLVYFDILGYPLTAREVHRNLINPVRIRSADEKIRAISAGKVADELAHLTQTGRIVERNGFYMLSPDRLNLYESRIDREKIAAQKWRKVMRLARWFRAVPFLRGIFVSGSLAMGNSSERGDFDTLLVVRDGRLYTCRIFLSLVASVLGVRRKREDVFAPDKFCFNHYVAEQSLTISHESLFAAYAYANIVPVMAGQDLAGRFYAANPWINGYLYNFKPSEEHVRRTLPRNPTLGFVAAFFESILGGVLGDAIERVFRAYQQKRIRENPLTFEKGGRVVFTDERLEFHPRSAEPSVINRYNSGLRRSGVFPAIKEHVSAGIECA